MDDNSQNDNPWKTISSRSVYENAWIRVREDQVIRPDGLPGIYGVIETQAAVGVVALTELNEIYLVGQYRYPISSYEWEIVEGGVPRGEDTLSGAMRELAEETGIQARNWSQLGPPLHLSNCITDERAILYLAKDLEFGAAHPEPVEVLKIRKVPLDEAVRMVNEGEISDALSVIGILRAKALLS